MCNGSGERFIAMSKYRIRETSDKSTTPTHYSSINGIYCVCFVDLWHNNVAIRCVCVFIETFESHSNLLLLNRFNSHQVTPILLINFKSHLFLHICYSPFYFRPLTLLFVIELHQTHSSFDNVSNDNDDDDVCAFICVGDSSQFSRMLNIEITNKLSTLVRPLVGMRQFVCVSGYEHIFVKFIREWEESKQLWH